MEMKFYLELLDLLSKFFVAVQLKCEVLRLVLYFVFKLLVLNDK